VVEKQTQRLREPPPSRLVGASPARDTSPLYKKTAILSARMIGLDETALWDLMNGLRKEPVQVGWLHPGYKRAIGASTSIVWLSSYTIDHVALGRHRQRYYEVIKFTPDIILYGESRKIDSNKLMFVYADPDAPAKPYRAIVKAAAAGTEVFLESTYRIQRAQARKDLAKSPRILR
jgi:hypothetical protein